MTLNPFCFKQRIASTLGSLGDGHAPRATTARAQAREHSTCAIADTSSLHRRWASHAAMRRLTTWRRAGRESHNRMVDGGSDMSRRSGSARGARAESGADHACGCLVSISSPSVVESFTKLGARPLGLLLQLHAGVPAVGRLF